MKTSSILLASVTAVLAGSARADADIDLRSAFGFDSNPFELSDVIGRREAFFIDGDASVEATGEAVHGWRKRADIGFSGRIYERDDHEADQARLWVRARGGTEERDNQHGWDLSVRAQARDRTYVSRLTGAEATDSLGNDIGDRYDSMLGEIEGEWRFPKVKIGRFSIGANGTYRNYWRDYGSLGLTRLDYYEYALTPTAELGSGTDRVRVRVTGTERRYFNRRVDDAIGNPVPGTDLRYRYLGGDVRWQHRFSERGTFELGTDYEWREDNGVGFGDRTLWSFGAEWNWRPDENSRITLDGRYRKRAFDNQTGDETINDEAPEKKGIEFAVRYARPFPFVDIEGFSLIAEAGYEDYDNTDDPRFVYERWTALIGVRQQF
ncbi:MAG TPA: hypothetical protein VLD67_13040 [Vicinamibacterales bacterium]|nr:hypothetical protein [Vicinamibacterales bacterium]